MANITLIQEIMDAVIAQKSSSTGGGGYQLQIEVAFKQYFNVRHN